LFLPFSSLSNSVAQPKYCSLVPQLKVYFLSAIFRDHFLLLLTKNWYFFPNFNFLRSEVICDFHFLLIRNDNTMDKLSLAHFQPTKKQNLNRFFYLLWCTYNDRVLRCSFAHTCILLTVIIIDHHLFVVVIYAHLYSIDSQHTTWTFHQTSRVHELK
jgi:hypothetical protein